MAGAIELATAYIALIPSLKGASKGISDQMNPASAVAGAEGGSSLGSALVGGLKKFALPIAGVVAAFSVGKLVKDSVKDFQDYQGAVNGFGRIAGGSIQQFSGLREAIKLSGVDVDAAQGGLTIFSKNLGNAAQDGAKTSAMAKKLGTDFKDAAGNVKPMSEILPGVADKFKSMPDGAEKTALAMSLFGRSGAQMLPFLNQGSAGIAALTEKAGKMGLILDDTDKKIFAASKSGIREYQESIKGLHVAIGSTVLPIMTAWGNVGRSIAVPMIQALAGAMQAARGPMLALAGHVQLFADKMRGLTSGVIAKVAADVHLFFGGFHDGVDAIGSNQSMLAHWGAAVFGVFAGVKETVREFFEGIKTGSAFVGPSVAGTFGHIGNIVHEAFGTAKTAVQVFFDGLKTGSNDAGGGFLGAIGGIGNTLHGLWDAIGPLLPQIGQLATSFSPLHLIFEAIAPVLPQIASALGELASALGGALGSVLPVIVPVLVDLAKVITGALGDAAKTVLPVLVGLIPTIADAFTQLAPVVADLVKQIAPLIKAILPPLVDLFKALAPVVADLIKEALPLAVKIIKELVDAFVPLIKDVLPLAVKIIKELAPVVADVFGVIVDVIKAALKIVQGIIEVVTGIISGDWGMVWQGICDIFSGIWNAIVAVVGGVLGILWAVISGALGGIGSFIGDILGNIGNFFSDTWNNITNGVGGFIDGFIGFFNDLPGRIMNALVGAGSWLIDVGKNIVQGLIDGIASMGSAVMNMFLNILPEAIRGPIKTALGIASPSKVFRGYGKNIGEGLILGAADTKSEISATMRGLVSVPDMPAFGAPSASIAGNGRGGSGATFNTTINQVDDPIGTAHAVTRRQLALSS